MTTLDEGPPLAVAPHRPVDLDRAGPSALDLLLVCSSGGHLAQLAALDPWTSRHRRHWVVLRHPGRRQPAARGARHLGPPPYDAQPAHLLRNLVLAWRLLGRERPDVVLSTGAGTALPFFVVARLRGIPTVYLEVYDRIDTPTLTGRLCRPFTDRMLVQWDEQARLYRGAEVVGVVL